MGHRSDLRRKLVDAALAWERAFGVAPSITSALSEFDAAMLVGCTAKAYAASMVGATAVRQGHDFTFNGARYQVKANRPSGKPGSFVTLVPKAKNYDWDFLVWLLYDPQYVLQEAWLWERAAYLSAFDAARRLAPAHYRQGRRLA